MRPAQRRIAAGSAVAYLLAGWLAAALHSHGHAGHGHAAEADATCTACRCGHHHGGNGHGGEKAGREPDAPGCPEGDHGHCVVCDFLAKPPAPATAVAVVTAAEPLFEQAEPRLPAYAPVEAATARSRGPPAA